MTKHEYDHKREALTLTQAALPFHNWKVNFALCILLSKNIFSFKRFLQSLKTRVKVLVHFNALW